MARCAVSIGSSVTCCAVSVAFSTESVAGNIESTEAGGTSVNVNLADTCSTAEVTCFVWKVTPVSVPQWVTLAYSISILIGVGDTVFTFAVSRSVASATHLSTFTLVN